MSCIYKNIIIYLLVRIFFDYFAIEFANEKYLLIGAIARLGMPNRNPPYCTI